LNTEFTPSILTYRCIPICERFGIVECVSNAISAVKFDCSSLPSLDDSKKEIFLKSLAGSSLSSFVLGIRDRHQDNMLVKDGHIFFNIDFGHLWNQGPFFDAPRIAVPMRIKANLSQEEWAWFENICEKGFAVLLKYRSMIKEICMLLFSPITQPNPSVIEEFISSNNSLMFNLSEANAKLAFKRVLTRSLANHNPRRKFKNLLHGLGRSEPAIKKEDPADLRTRTLGSPNNSIGEPREKITLTRTKTTVITDTPHVSLPSSLVRTKTSAASARNVDNKL